MQKFPNSHTIPFPSLSMLLSILLVPRRGAFISSNFYKNKNHFQRFCNYFGLWCMQVYLRICIKRGTIPGEKEQYIHVENADKYTYLGKDHFETMLVFSILVMGNYETFSIQNKQVVSSFDQVKLLIGRQVTPFWTFKPQGMRGRYQVCMWHRGSHSTRIHLQLLQKFYFCKQSFPKQHTPPQSHTHTHQAAAPSHADLTEEESLLSFYHSNELIIHL